MRVSITTALLVSAFTVYGCEDTSPLSRSSTGVTTSEDRSEKSAGIASAVDQSYWPTNPHERVATERELRRFLTDGPPEYWSGAHHSSPEYFYNDGRYARRGFHPISSSYSVVGNVFCVPGLIDGRPQICRSMTIGPRGPYIVDVESH